MADQSRRQTLTTVAGLIVVAALIAAAIPGAVAGSWLTPVPSAPLPSEIDRPQLAASKVVIPGAADIRGDVAGAAASNDAPDDRDRAGGAGRVDRADRADRPALGEQVGGWAERGGTAVPSVRAKAVSRIEAAATAAAGSYKGRNHVWIPALGINRSVNAFACTSSAYPGDVVYRWGCAGRNNVYLFGHAYSVFKPLHDAYVRGNLRKGMQVIYADGSGTVSTYAVSWWKVTTPDKGAWAYAAQRTPSLTLQTCVGARSEYRLIVRLTKIG